MWKRGYRSSFFTCIQSVVPPQSISCRLFSFLCGPTLKKAGRRLPARRGGGVGGCRVRWSDQRRKGQAEEAEGGPSREPREEEGAGKQALRPGCCGVSALTGMSGASVHLRCPLGQFPWKLTAFLILTHIYAVDPTPAVIPVARAVQTGRVKKLLELLMVPFPLVSHATRRCSVSPRKRSSRSESG